MRIKNDTAILYPTSLGIFIIMPLFEYKRR
jgi:hypothetical protein